MQTIGERLEEARKKKGISIREAAEATKIRGDYLQKFESNHFDIGLTEIYTRGFLRNYGNFLKLPTDRLLADYAALGHGEARSRQPSREIYGRMDVSAATAGEAGERAAPSEEKPAVSTPEPVRTRAQPHYPRSGGASLPTGPDPAVVFKYAKIGGGVILLLVVVLVVKSLFSSNSAAPGASHAPAPVTVAAQAEPPPVGSTVTLIGLDTVVVTVNVMNPDASDGPELFRGTLARGQRQVVSKPGPIYITASAAENLGVEYMGAKCPVPFTGYKKVKLP